MKAAWRGSPGEPGKVKCWGRSVVAGSKLSFGCELRGEDMQTCGTTWAAAQGRTGWVIFSWSAFPSPCL